jgi:uncharacterized membrane protein
MDESPTATVGLVVGTLLAALTLVVVLVGVFQLSLVVGATLALFAALVFGSVLAVAVSSVGEAEGTHEPGDDTGAGAGSTADRVDGLGATDGALAELRRRYAAGELSEAQFEGRVERLLADEGSDTDVDDARAVLELRYARGELTDEQFDRKLARLDGTRTVESAEDAADADAERSR